MNTKPIEEQFLRMGVRLKVTAPEIDSRRWWSQQTEYSLDVQRDRKGEHFVLTIPEEREAELKIGLLQNRPKERHLLLMVRDQEETIDRFLCGHDEREWFVAAVPGAVSTVNDAMESLKPSPVLRAQERARLNGKERKRRKNAAFRRQGEWFFVPVDDPVVDESRLLRWEPIARSGGKPHMVEELIRTGGELIYLCRNRPNGLREKEYRKLLQGRPSAKNWNWQAQRVNPGVFARGDIRHPDHRTITLHDWHRVLMNTENESRTMSKVAFID